MCVYVCVCVCVCVKENGNEREGERDREREREREKERESTYECEFLSVTCLKKQRLRGGQVLTHIVAGCDGDVVGLAATHGVEGAGGVAGGT